MAALGADQVISIHADVLPCSSNLPPSIAHCHRDCARLLARLDEYRKFYLPGFSLQPHNVAILHIELCCQCGRDSNIVAPRYLADGIGKFLEPRVVGMTAIAQGHAFIQVKFVTVAGRRSLGLLLARQNPFDRSLGIAMEPGHHPGSRGRDSYNTILK